MASKPTEGRELLWSSEQIARRFHSCDRPSPNCDDMARIFPGDRYLREVWKCWRTVHGSKKTWFMILKYHVMPGCQPHPDFWEDSWVDDEKGESLPIAA